MSENIKRLNVPIPAQLHKDLKVTVAKQGKTLAQWVLEAVQDKLQKESNTEK